MNGLITTWAKPGWDFAVRHERAGDRSQIDLPRMRGAADAMVPSRSATMPCTRTGVASSTKGRSVLRPTYSVAGWTRSVAVDVQAGQGARDSAELELQRRRFAAAVVDEFEKLAKEQKGRRPLKRPIERRQRCSKERLSI